MSDSLPAIRTTIVEATIVGRAGATRVRLSDATSEPSISPAKTARTARSAPFFSGVEVESRAATAVIQPTFQGADRDEKPRRPKPASLGSAPLGPRLTIGPSTAGEAGNYPRAARSRAGCP